MDAEMKQDQTNRLIVFVEKLTAEYVVAGHPDAMTSIVNDLIGLGVVRGLQAGATRAGMESLCQGIVEMACRSAGRR